MRRLGMEIAYFEPFQINYMVISATLKQLGEFAWIIFVSKGTFLRILS